MMRISLKAARVNAGLTQMEVSEKLGISKKTVHSWENGKTKPKLDKVEPLCFLYGLTYDDIEWNV